MLAARYPERVHSILMLAPAINHGLDDDLFQTLIQSLDAEVSEVTQALDDEVSRVIQSLDTRVSGVIQVLNRGDPIITVVGA